MENGNEDENENVNPNLNPNEDENEDENVTQIAQITQIVFMDVFCVNGLTGV